MENEGGVGLMAQPKRKGKSGRPVKGASAEDRETVIHMKGSPEYVAWLEAAHRKTHIPKVQIFRLALADWATKMGLPEPPEI
jgi:hypothetical protein